MNFKRLALLMLFAVSQVSLFAAENKKYQGKKITSSKMDMFNVILVSQPTITLRMAMAAQRGQTVVNNIAKLKPVGKTAKGGILYFNNTKDEKAFIKEELAYVLAPVEKFMDDIKEYRLIVKDLLFECLGKENAKESLICKALDDAKDSFQVYFYTKITSVSELQVAATEFLVFFADVSASLSESAKKSYDRLLVSLNITK